MLHYVVKNSSIIRKSMIGISKEFCVDDVMLNSCLSLFTNMRSESEGRLLGQGLWSNLFYSLHINKAIAAFSFYSAWLIVVVFQKVGWNVRGVKCPRVEMSSGWNIFGVKYLRGEMSWHRVCVCVCLLESISIFQNYETIGDWTQRYTRLNSDQQHFLPKTCATVFIFCHSNPYLRKKMWKYCSNCRQLQVLLYFPKEREILQIFCNRSLQKILL